ncbi:GAF domain-containing protein [Fulvitalea axinellae]
METVRQLARAVEEYETIPEEDRRSVLSSLMRRELENNDELLSVWSKLETYAIDSLAHEWIGKRGSSVAGNFYYTFYKDEGEIKLRRSRTKKAEDVFTNGYYVKLKASKGESLLDPYNFSYGGNSKNFLQANLLSSVLKDGEEFMGTMGVDISMEQLKKIVQSADYHNEGNAILFYEDYHKKYYDDNERYVAAKNIYIEDSVLFESIQTEITEKIKSEPVEYQKDLYQFALTDSLNREFIAFTVPIKVGKAPERWYFTQLIPYDVINSEATAIIWQTAIISLAGIGLIILIVYNLIRSITTPLIRITELLGKMAKGEKVKLTKRKVTDDENETTLMYQALEAMNEGIDEKAKFALAIGNEDYSQDLQIKSDEDMLGKALLQMKQSLVAYREKEQAQNWMSEGIAEFSSILRMQDQSFEKLADDILAKLIRYLDANQGVIALAKEIENSTMLVQTATYAYGRTKHVELTIAPGQGLMGQVFLEKEPRYLTEIPQGYIRITSGLGESTPKAIYIVPLISNDEVYGVMEIASFQKFSENERIFINKIAESIASSVSVMRSGELTKKMLAESRSVSDELRSREEEHRQNMEELAATNEEQERMRKGFEDEIAFLKEKIRKMEEADSATAE